MKKGEYHATLTAGDIMYKASHEELPSCLEALQPKFKIAKHILEVQKDGKSYVKTIWPRFLKRIMVSGTYRRILSKYIIQSLK